MIDKFLDGRYRVVELLAAGGFSQTYVAEDTHRPGNPKCVVKHLKPPSSESGFLQNARRLFQAEAETLEKLGNHDQIPRLLAYFEENQEFYLVQEFIEGNPLSTEILPDHCWSESQVIQLLQEVLGILVFVHCYGLIHRDIKPNNLIRRQQDNRLVLIDFGSVKQAWTQVAIASGQTNASIAIGTQGYMPTEQARGKPRPNSDIYALGMIGIQALTGLHPTQLIEDSDTGESLWQDQAYVSEALASVLTKMVRYHFKDRYQTVAEVLQALQLVVNREEPDFDAGKLPVKRFSTPQATALSGQPSQNPLSGQNIIPVAVANPSNTLVNSQASSPAAISPEPSRLPTATRISAPQPTILSPRSPQAPSSSKNVIPSEETANSLATQVDLPESHPTLPATPKQYRLLICAGITAVLISVVAGYAFYWQPRLSIGKTLEQIETLKAEGKYEECVNQAKTVTQDSRFYTADAQALLYECQLAQATKLAVGSNFPGAIAEAGKIPQDATSYQDAQQLIAQWSDSILEKARNQYQSGNLNEAIAIAKTIPTTSPVYQKAEAAIQEWNGEWKKNNSYWQAAQKALDVGKWQDAISEAQKVIDTPYWQEKIKPTIEKAESKIAASKTTVTSQPIRAATRSPIRTTPRVTRAATRSPIRTTPRVTRRAATRSPIRTTSRVTRRAATRSPIRTTSRVTRAATRSPIRTTPRVTRAATRPATRSAAPKRSSGWQIETR